MNQVARREPDKARGLVELGERLRKAQAGAGGDVRGLIESEREALQKLVQDARKLLEREGRSTTDATMQRVARILQAAAADEETGAQLARGSLPDEPEPVGFDVFAGIAPARKSERRQQKPKPDRTRQLREKLREARAEARERARAADRAERDAARARAEADEAEKAVREIEKNLDG